ncbi:hypothetical protein B0H14DRAFT_2339083, partial [Mycena olivaceomarginata]
LIAMYILSTMHIVCRWIIMRNAFINNGDTSITISLYLLQPPLWLTVLAAVVFTVNTLVADIVLIWRCWTIWNRNWWVVTLPICCTLAGAGKHANHRVGWNNLINIFRPWVQKHPRAGGVCSESQSRQDKVHRFATPYFSLSLVTTCLSTLLIIFRIITMTERTTRKSRGYSRVIEIIVESALLYSIAMAIFLPLLVTDSSNDAYAQAVVGQITGLAPTLIVARVTFVLARPDETWQQPTTMLFYASSGPGSTHLSGSIALGHVHDIGVSNPIVSKSSRFRKQLWMHVLSVYMYTPFGSFFFSTRTHEISQ